MLLLPDFVMRTAAEEVYAAQPSPWSLILYPFHNFTFYLDEWCLWQWDE